LGPSGYFIGTFGCLFFWMLAMIKIEMKLINIEPELEDDYLVRLCQHLDEYVGKYIVAEGRVTSIFTRDDA
jgi:hypothetical protein